MAISEVLAACEGALLDTMNLYFFTDKNKLFYFTLKLLFSLLLLYKLE